MLRGRTGFSIRPQFHSANNKSAHPNSDSTTHLTRLTIRKRHQKSWQPSGDSRKANEIYLLRIQQSNEQPMKSMKNINRLIPVVDSLDEEAMTWQDDEMSSHLQQTTRLQTDDNSSTRLSNKNMQSKQVVTRKMKNMQKY